MVKKVSTLYSNDTDIVENAMSPSCTGGKTKAKASDDRMFEQNLRSRVSDPPNGGAQVLA